MNDNQFKMHFRMTPTTFEDLICKAATVARIGANNVNHVGHPRIDIEKECLIVIWCLGNLESFRSVADRFGITKSTCWDVLYRTSHLLLRLSMEYKIIDWPKRDRQNIISNQFNSDGFTGIIGCIDGSHIRIRAPRQNRNSYINRRGYHSILLQGVCDHTKAFINVYIGEAGSIHDYTLYKRSDLYVGLQSHNILVYDDNYLLGDSAYKLATNLIVPFKNNGLLTTRQQKFNNIHSSKRMKIENAFALLKGRFRRLKLMETVKMDLLLVMTACILHNVCIFNGDIPNDLMDLDQELREERHNHSHNVIDIVDEEYLAQHAVATRNNIANAIRLDR